MDNYIDENLWVVINGEAQLHALVDGKKIIITESSIRRDLQLADEEGVDCLPNSIIFEQLALMEAIPIDPHHTPTFIQSSPQPQKTQKPRKPKRKDTQVPQPSDPTESVVDEAVYKELGDSLVRVATTASSLEAEQDSGNINKTQSKAIPNESSSQGTNLGGGPRGNTLQSDEDRIKFDELMVLCTTLQNKVLDLEQTKTSQQNEIASFKRRVKKLEKKDRSRTHKLKKLYKVAFTAKVESSDDEESLVDEEVVEVINIAKLIVDAAQVSAAGDKVSTASAATTVSAAMLGIIFELIRQNI
ncbi:hypothetical protein Tco_0417141 [Tanacetum coccineum]